ncbi:hypothetical protein BC938DRAFT_481336 [Jimgerdemannia flammicorona]|uniref:Uncharacterized protein n=1 Tax=Jimgerdemannia flammicorona TaxID=994334 RepID=A0A433QGE8_9FUNG|nr:hypothetical protein BC938DRAFT_481336 [Jimgerdemannia flammicorona]
MMTGVSIRCSLEWTMFDLSCGYPFYLFVFRCRAKPFLARLRLVPYFVPPFYFFDISGASNNGFPTEPPRRRSNPRSNSLHPETKRWVTRPTRPTIVPPHPRGANKRNTRVPLNIPCNQPVITPGMCAHRLAFPPLPPSVIDHVPYAPLQRATIKPSLWGRRRRMIISIYVCAHFSRLVRIAAAMVESGNFDPMSEIRP